MNKRDIIILLIFISFFFTPRAVSIANDIFSEKDEPESIEELSSEISSTLPNASSQYVDELAEAVYLIKKLEREIDLTRQIIELREKDEYPDEIPEAEEAEMPEDEIPSYAKSPEVLEFVRKITDKMAAKSMTVAKKPADDGQPSSEDESVAEQDKKKKPAAISSSPMPPRLKVYREKELGAYMRSVVIEKDQELLIPAAGLKRFMVTEPKMLSAKRVEGKVSITGVGLGRSYMHVWDAEGRRTIKVTVTQKGYQRFTAARREAIAAARMDSFKIRYSYDQYRFDSSSETAARAYMYEENFHRLNITGQTPWGRASSFLQYENRFPSGDAEDTGDLTYWDFSLRGDDMELSLGNVGARFSDITLPQTGYQGFRFKNPDDKKVNYDVVWGARGNRMWGYRVLDWDTANYFYGGRFEVNPADFIQFNSTALKSAEYDDEAAKWIVASGMGLYFFDDMLTIEAEAARNKNAATERHNHAYQIDTIIDLDDYDLLLKGKYVDIDPDYRVVTGMTAPNVGKLGCRFNADYNPFDYLRVTSQYDYFRNRFSFNLTETKRYNQDWRSTADFNIGLDTKFRYMLWTRNREGEATPSRGRGEMYQVSHKALLPEPFRSADVSFRYEPTRYKNLNDPTPNYRERKYTANMRMNVLKNLYYDLSHSWHYRKMTATAERGTVKSLGTGISYSSQLLDTPFYGSASLRYKKEYDVMDNLTLTAGENTFTGQGEIKYRPSSELETYLKLNYRRVRGVLDHSKSREEVRIYGGGSYFFDTTLRWGIGGSIEGYVFEDANGNGEKDIGEKGFGGIDVYAGEEYATITDGAGRFEFDGIKYYELTVMYDPQMLPEGYRPTSPNPQTAVMEQDEVSEIYFGALAVAEISGIVYNDINMNKTFDAGDKGVRAVFLALDSGVMAVSMATGHYRMEDVRPGEKTLTLDATSLPYNLLPLTKVKRAVGVEGGKEYKEDFPVYALRTIVGVIFVDSNGDGRFDAGEKGVEDIVVRCAGTATITDNKGRYFLKKVPGREQEVVVDVESIPSEYVLSVSPSRSVELSIEGEIREDIDFALKKK